MKGRESGMSDGTMRSSFFDPPTVLSRLGLNAQDRDVAEFGCGFGTFTIPAARMTRGFVHAFDIEPDMIAVVEAKARQAVLQNVRLHLRDFLAEGTGLPDASVDFAMLFNILHVEHPLALLQEARRILIPRGRVGVIHWNFDPSTPRGPSMEIRPRPESCMAWMAVAGFALLSTQPLELPPYHYGLVGTRVSG